MHVETRQKFHRRLIHSDKSVTTSRDSRNSKDRRLSTINVVVAATNVTDVENRLLKILLFNKMLCPNH